VTGTAAVDALIDAAGGAAFVAIEMDTVWFFGPVPSPQATRAAAVSATNTPDVPDSLERDWGNMSGVLE
jgi:hypothetical protein